MFNLFTLFKRLFSAESLTCPECGEPLPLAPFHTGPSLHCAHCNTYHYVRYKTGFYDEQPFDFKIIGSYKPEPKPSAKKDLSAQL